MAREARIVVPGAPHHVTQRGNNRQDIFFLDRDYHAYLEFLLEACALHGVDVQAYCLMTNHVHLVLTPHTEPALTAVMEKVSTNHAVYVNDRYRRTGHLWQGRFYSCPMDEEHFWAAVRYAECNPVRAGLADNAWEYRQSSALAHVARQGDSRLLDLSTWRTLMPPDEWRQTLAEMQPFAQVDELRRNTRSGRPWGSEQFVRRLEVQLGRTLRAAPRGRPRNVK